MRARNPAIIAPATSATQNTQRWLTYSPPAKIAGPVLRAGFTDVLVMGIEITWMRVSPSPIGMPAKLVAAPFDAGR